MNTVAAIRFPCPHCDTRIKAKPRCAGGYIRCPAAGCGLSVLVPPSSPAARPTPRPGANKISRRLLMAGGFAFLGLILLGAIAIQHIASKRGEGHAQTQIATLQEQMSAAEQKHDQTQRQADDLDKQLQAERANRQQQEKGRIEAGRKFADLERDLVKTRTILKAEQARNETIAAREAKMAADLAAFQKDGAAPISSVLETTLPDCYYLSVGVDNYANAGRLNGCLNDARNIAACFQAQQNQRFAKASGAVLLDGSATHADIARELNQLKQVGKRGDFVVIFLSGHGAQQSGRWYFLPFDFQANRHDATGLSDLNLLQTADHLAGRGLKAFVIIDACFAGYIRHAAQKMLNNPGYSEGGIVLMMSSMPSQTSKALGHYSAFAQAIHEGLKGKADLDGDGYVSMREIRRYAYHRTYELCRDANQDGECDYSLSISENMRLAKVLPQTFAAQKINPPVASTAPLGKNGGLIGAAWIGSETLQGYGQLEFRFEPNQVAVMKDRDGNSYGRWTKTNNQVRLTFYDGTVVYDGRITDKTISGTARNAKGSWTFNVAR